MRASLLAVIAAGASVLTACGGGGGSGGSGGTPGPVPTSVTVSGTVSYERVPFSATVNSLDGLDYAATVAAPVRAAVVQLLGTNSAVLQTTATDPAGRYSFADVSVNTTVSVRVKAQSVATGTPGWDFSVLNNTNSNALYVLDSTAFSTGTANVTRNLLADSGWPDFNGTSYGGVRAAAPFALLDTMYSAVQFVVSQGSSTVQLPALQIFWSTQNRSALESWRPDVGDIISTLYQAQSRDGFPPGIYVLGLEDVDTDEYDQHVLAHEFQHFLENSLSRSDTPGGDHAVGEKLDMRLAFSEGFANAFSAMVLDDPQYRDSFGARQGNSFNFNMETELGSPAGWFNEGSIHGLIWDLYDGAADTSDAVQLGYGPLSAVMRNELRTGQALTSIFPLVTALKAQAGAPVSALDTLVASRAIRASDIDPFGSTETNNGGVAQALPVYTDMALNGPVVQVCGSATAGTYNKLGNRRFLRFNLPGARTITVTVTSNEAGLPVPDPDFWLYGSGAPQVSETATDRVEQATFENVPAGGYVLEVYEYSHIDPAATNNTSRGPTCMNVTVTG